MTDKRQLDACDAAYRAFYASCDETELRAYWNGMILQHERAIAALYVGRTSPLNATERAFLRDCYFAGIAFARAMLDYLDAKGNDQ